MSMIFLSEQACNPLQDRLAREGHEIRRVCASDAVYPAISAHADIYMCKVADTLLVDETVRLDPPLREEYMAAMESQSGDPAENPVIPALAAADGRGHIVFNMGAIGYEYPDDVPYNAVATRKYLIHNTEFTAPAVLDRARFAGLNILRVSQGYTRCSCLPVGDSAFITADEGIASVIRGWNEQILEESGENTDPSFNDDLIDLLVIRPGHIRLEGFPSGFIGGTAGTVGSSIYFNGDLMAHPDGQAIARFIEAHGLKPVWFSGEPLTDIGSIFEL